MDIIEKLPFDKYEVWQINDTNGRSPYKFMGYSFLEKYKFSPSRRDYIKVYEANLEDMDLEGIGRAHV